MYLVIQEENDEPFDERYLTADEALEAAKAAADTAIAEGEADSYEVRGNTVIVLDEDGDELERYNIVDESKA